MSQDVKRFDCTNGGAAWCQGCYTMSEDEHGDYVQAEDYDALLAENERLRAEVEKWEGPCREFLDKTQWVQDTAKPRELGLHRADVLRQRIEQAEARAERLEEALRVIEGFTMSQFRDASDMAGACVETAHNALHHTAAQENDDA